MGGCRHYAANQLQPKSGPGCLSLLCGRAPRQMPPNRSSLVARRRRLGELTARQALDVLELFQTPVDEGYYRRLARGAEHYPRDRALIRSLTTAPYTLAALHLAAALGEDLPLLTADREVARAGHRHRARTVRAGRSRMVFECPVSTGLRRRSAAFALCRCLDRSWCNASTASDAIGGAPECMGSRQRCASGPLIAAAAHARDPRRRRRKRAVQSRYGYVQRLGCRNLLQASRADRVHISLKRSGGRTRTTSAGTI